MPFQNSRSLQNPWQIHALSFDFDNCIFHSGYVWHWDDSSQENAFQVINKNKPFLDTIKENNSSYEENVVFVGSTRQSEYIDDLNSASLRCPRLITESCFSATRKICQYLAPITLDKFLLDDVFCDHPDGATFDNVIAHLNEKQSNFLEKIKKKEYNIQLIADKSKLLILYAQMHKTAKANPNKRILFDFYDDQGTIVSKQEKKLLLDDLHAYFSQYPEMIPSNVTLQLNHYKGKDVTPYSLIQGSGSIDTDYRNTIKRLAHAVPQIAPFEIIAVQHITPSKLHLLNKEKSETIRHGYLGFFNPYKPNLGSYIDSLSQKANNPVQSSFRP